MSKLYICGITQNKCESIQRMVELCEPYVDGFVYVDGGSIDETVSYLETIPKVTVIFRRWTRDHDLSMNEFLRAGIMKNGDYFVILDSTDLPNEDWIKGLKEDITHYSKNNVGLVNLDRPLIVRYFDHMRIVGSPHWGIQGVVGETVNLSAIEGYQKESYIYNKRDTLQSAFLHPTKYYFEYGYSNHTQLLYLQFGQQAYDYHENLRLQFRWFCERILNIPLTLDGLKEYMKKPIAEWESYFASMVELEVNLKDIFRLEILGQPWEKLAENRFNWSLQKYAETGAIEQGKLDGYVGRFNMYRKQQGKDYE